LVLKTGPTAVGDDGAVVDGDEPPPAVTCLTYVPNLAHVRATGVRKTVRKVTARVSRVNESRTHWRRRRCD